MLTSPAFGKREEGRRGYDQQINRWYQSSEVSVLKTPCYESDVF